MLHSCLISICGAFCLLSHAPKPQTFPDPFPQYPIGPLSQGPHLLLFGALLGYLPMLESEPPSLGFVSLPGKGLRRGVGVGGPLTRQCLGSEYQQKMNKGLNQGMQLSHVIFSVHVLSFCLKQVASLFLSSLPVLIGWHEMFAV